MKNLRHFLGLLVVAAFLTTACEEDPIIGPVDNPPSVSATTSSINVGPGESFTVSVSATAGDADMNSLSIFEENTIVDLSRITAISGTTANNPLLLFDGDRSSFSFDIDINAHMEPGTSAYNFDVTDANGEVGTASVSITVEATPPSIVYNGSMSIEGVELEGLVSLALDVTTGSTALSTISVLEDGALISDPSRLALGSDTFDANPYTLSGDDIDGFMKDLFIRASDEGGTKTYTVVITDGAGMTANLNIDITAGTAVNVIMGALFNSAGPAGTGGLDLDEGIGTGSSDPTAEIKDLGIDIELPNAENWIQRVAGINGFEMRYLFPGQNGLSESFSFDGLEFSDEIPGLWENGLAFTSMDQDMNLVSFVVEVDDWFIVSDGTKYFVLRVAEVNSTADDNADNYVIDIKS